MEKKLKIRNQFKAIENSKLKKINDDSDLSYLAQNCPPRPSVVNGFVSAFAVGAAFVFALIIFIVG